MTSASRVPGPWPGDLEDKPAPGALRLVQALVNTLDMETGLDRLADVADARSWLIENGLLGATAEVAPRELAGVIAVREAVRALIIHHTGGPEPTAEALAPLQDLAAAAAVRAVVDRDGTVRLTPDGDALPALLLQVLLTVKDAQLDGTWGHLKACANDECQWAFYDRSRNHGGTWCDMTTCGNKIKNRDFRARKRSGGQVPHEGGGQRA